MFILANFVEALAQVIYYVLEVYMWIVIARAVISWVNPDPYNPVVRFLYGATEPVLFRLRRVLPLYGGGIDFSPILVFVVIIFLQRFLVQTLFDLAQALRFAG